MAATQTTRQTFVDQTRNEARTILTAIDNLAELKRRWDRGMNAWIVDASGSDPTEPGYTPGDFDGCRGLMKADIASVFTTLAAFETLLAAGHGTNLEAVR